MGNLFLSPAQLRGIGCFTMKLKLASSYYYGLLVIFIPAAAYINEWRGTAIYPGNEFWYRAFELPVTADNDLHFRSYPLFHSVHFFIQNFELVAGGEVCIELAKYVMPSNGLSPTVCSLSWILPRHCQGSCCRDLKVQASLGQTKTVICWMHSKYQTSYWSYCFKPAGFRYQKVLSWHWSTRYG